MFLFDGFKKIGAPETQKSGEKFDKIGVLVSDASKTPVKQPVTETEKKTYSEYLEKKKNWLDANPNLKDFEKGRLGWLNIWYNLKTDPQKTQDDWKKNLKASDGWIPNFVGVIVPLGLTMIEGGKTLTNENLAKLEGKTGKDLYDEARNTIISEFKDSPDQLEGLLKSFDARVREMSGLLGSLLGMRINEETRQMTAFEVFQAYLQLLTLSKTTEKIQISQKERDFKIGEEFFKAA